MSEDLNESWVYETSPGAMFRMLTRLDHLTQQAAELRYQQFAVRELRERDGFFMVRAERTVPEGRRGRPDLVRHTQRWEPPAWDGSRRFEAFARLGSTLTVTGQGLLQPAGPDRTRYSMRLTIASSARFFSGPAEREAAATTADTLAEEHRFREQWLAQQSPVYFRLSA